MTKRRTKSLAEHFNVKVECPACGKIIPPRRKQCECQDERMTLDEAMFFIGQAAEAAQSKPENHEADDD